MVKKINKKRGNKMEKEMKMNEFTKDELEIAKIVLVKKNKKQVRTPKGWYCAVDVMFYINQPNLINEMVSNLEDMLVKATKWIKENDCKEVIESLVYKIK